MTLRHQILQLLTPDALRGRVTAANLVFVQGGPQLLTRREVHHDEQRRALLAGRVLRECAPGSTLRKALLGVVERLAAPVAVG